MPHQPATQIHHPGTRQEPWHFGRFERGQIIHADQGEMERLGMGGTFMVFPPGNNGQVSLDYVTGQRGVMPGASAVDMAAFVRYCGTHYGNDINQASYFYVYFG
jgi:hypothetical protein